MALNLCPNPPNHALSAAALTEWASTAYVPRVRNLKRRYPKVNKTDDELVEIWNHAVRTAQVARRLRTRDAAEDVIQTGFLALWKAVQSGHEIENIEAYAYGIASRQSGDAIKKAIRRRETFVPLEKNRQTLIGGTDDRAHKFDADQTRDKGLNPEEQLLVKERAAIVRQAVAKINDPRRLNVIRKCFFEGRTNTEAQAELGLTDGQFRSVKSRVISNLGVRTLALMNRRGLKLAA